MSKKIIAGLGVVAGLAVALAPTASFATIGTDNFQITVNESCNFTATGYTAATTDPVAAETPFSNTYTRTLEAGQLVEIAGGAYTTDTQNPAATIVTVTCNHDSRKNAGTTAGHGYQIKAAATPLYLQVNNTDSTENIPLADPSQGVSGWGAKLSVTTTKSNTVGDVDGDMELASGYGTSSYKALPSDGVVASGNTSRAAGDVFTIVGYEVSTNNSQKAGTYKGSVTYTFVAPVDGTN